MTPLDEIRAAIERLERLRDETRGLIYISDGSLGGNKLAKIVTLHATIDPMLAALRHVAAHHSGDLGISTNRHVVALARAINNGGSNE